LKEPLKRNIIANYLGQGWVALMGIAFVPMYIRYLGMEAYGLIGLFAVLQACLTLLDLGMTPTLNRELARYTAGAHSAESIRDLVHTFELICAAMAILIVIVLSLASDRIANDWLNPKGLEIRQVATALGVMGLVAALRFQEGLYRGALLGLQKHVWLNAVLAGMATLRGVGAVLVLAYVAPTIHAFFTLQAVVSLLTLVIMRWAVHWQLPATVRRSRFVLREFKETWHFAGGIMATTFLALALTQVDKILLSRLLSLEQFGVYAFAASVAGVLSQLVAPVAQSYFPRFTELVTQGEEKAAVSVYHQGAQLATLVLTPAGLMLIVFGKTLLVAWTGDTQLATQAHALVALMALGTVLNGFMNIPYMLQLAYGWSTLSARINAVAVALVIPGLLVIVPRFGALGAAWVWVGVNTGYVLLGIQLMHKRILPAEKRRWYWQDVFVPCSATASVALLAKWVVDRGMGLLPEIAGTAFAALVIVFAALMSIPLGRNILRRMWPAMG